MTKFDYESTVAKGLTAIFKETRTLSHTMFADETELAQCQTLVYDRVPNQKHPKKGTPITVVHDGTVATGYKNADNYRTAILNFADAITPGGLVLIGGTTQEENICRCTNLYEAITTGHCIRDYYRANAKNGGGVYLDKTIYSADVTIFRDDDNYKMVSPKKVDVITCPAPCTSFQTDKQALKVYRRRIRSFINSAILNEAECIVLGAWGCGAFGQDPKLVSQAFVEVLNEVSGAFKKVVFAFRGTPGEGVWHDRTATTFVNEFNANYKWGVN